jgi:phage tail-like protein
VRVICLSNNFCFKKDSHGADPYRRHLFRVKWEVEGEWRTVLGVSKVSGLKKFIEVNDSPTGVETFADHKIPRRTNFVAITLERGITADPEFDKWANAILNREKSNEELADFKRNLLLEILNEKLKPVARYRLLGCWLSEYAISDFDAMANDIAIETIKVEIESWHRDTDLTEEK